MILSNGRIYTLDGRDRVVDTLFVRGGRIAFAGRRRDLNAPAGEPEIDLGGRAVLPGLVDAHGHLMYLARLRLTLDVAGLASETACADRVAARAATLPGGAWIAGRGWDQNRWPGGAFPTRASLDRAAPGHPVALVRVDGHAIWASSAALRLAGVDRRTPDPPGGRLERDAAGEPTGVLVDTAQELIRRVEPRTGPAHLAEAVKAAVTDCLAVGLTGVHEMGADLDALAAYRRLEAAGAFPFRNHVALRGADAAAWQAALDEGPTGGPDGRVRVAAVKLMADGALGSRGAALHAPYCDDPANRGLLLLPFDELEARARAAAERGFQVCVHAIGDRANTLVLDALESVLGGRPSAARRPPGRSAGNRPTAPGGARADPGGDGFPALPRSRRAAEHAADALHLGHAVGRRAPGGGATGRRLRLALPAPNGDRDRRRLGLPGRAAESVPRYPRGGDAPAARRSGSGVAARAADDARRRRCARSPSGTRTRRTRRRCSARSSPESGPIWSSARRTSSRARSRTIAAIEPVLTLVAGEIVLDRRVPADDPRHRGADPESWTSAGADVARELPPAGGSVICRRTAVSPG